MSSHYALALKPAIAHQMRGQDLFLFQPDGQAMRFAKPGPATRTLLSHLKNGGMTAEELCTASLGQEDGADLAHLYYAIAALERKGFINYTLKIDGQRFATAEPASAIFQLEQAMPHVPYRLSRFACLRRVGEEWLLESALGHATILLHDSRAGAAVNQLVAPHTPAELSATLPMLPPEATVALMSLLLSVGAIGACGANQRLAEDDNRALRQWEFHDLLFHGHSRLGRHAWPGSYPFRDVLPPLPAIKPAMSERRFALHRPDLAVLAAHDKSFSEVSESRRSIRGTHAQAVTAGQIGEFLYRSARVRSVQPIDAQGKGLPYETSWRVTPSGGAMHELELYLTISRCDGIAPGIYHYDPLEHALEHVSDLGTAATALLNDASRSIGQAAIDILITFAARHQRTSWKYPSIAYALTLKNVGVLYQQMYLAATAMDLAPCAVGGGNADLFAQATGLDYYTEPSVGEFVLAARPAASRKVHSHTSPTTSANAMADDAINASGPN